MKTDNPDYTLALRTLSELVKKYKVVRETGTINEVQDLRDDIGEALFWFGPKYATLRAEKERKEAIYKNCLAEKSEYWKKKFNSERGTAELIKSHSLLECKELQQELIDANEDFYLAKSIIERSDQIANSIATRFKLMNKHE